MNEFSDADKLACAERELKMRRRVYPNWIRRGNMREGQAAREIALMEAIVADYRAKAGAPDLVEQASRQTEQGAKSCQ